MPIPISCLRVLLNLARNAVQALETRAPNDPSRDQVRITGRREGAVVVIEVSDTGPGFPARAREHLFEAFQIVGAQRRHRAWASSSRPSWSAPMAARSSWSKAPSARPSGSPSRTGRSSSTSAATRGRGHEHDAGERRCRSGDLSRRCRDPRRLRTRSRPIQPIVGRRGQGSSSAASSISRPTAAGCCSRPSRSWRGAIARKAISCAAASSGSAPKAIVCGSRARTPIASSPRKGSARCQPGVIDERPKAEPPATQPTKTAPPARAPQDVPAEPHSPRRNPCQRAIRPYSYAAFRALACGISLAERQAPVAQLDRALDYEFRGQEFESLRARHFPGTSSRDRLGSRELSRCDARIAAGMPGARECAENNLRPHGAIRLPRGPIIASHWRP